MGFLTLCATISLVTTGLIIYVLIEETVSFFREVSFADFFLSVHWQPLFAPQSFGIWELVAGTANVVFWSLLIALPVGLASAVYLSEYAHPRTRRILKPVLEALASVAEPLYTGDVRAKLRF